MVGRTRKSAMLVTVLVLGGCLAAHGQDVVQYLKGRIETNWTITSRRAEIRQDQLYLDGLSEPGRLAVFVRYKEHVDPKMSATFRVERTGKGGKPFGLIFGSTDSQTFVAVEVRRGAVRLIQVEGGKEVKELGTRAIQDIGDEWQTVSFECQTSLVKVSYGGKEQFTANLPARPTGKLGVYTEGARAWVKQLSLDGQVTHLPKGWKLIQPGAK